jgi:hypothetical protein
VADAPRPHPIVSLESDAGRGPTKTHFRGRWPLLADRMGPVTSQTPPWVGSSSPGGWKKLPTKNVEPCQVWQILHLPGLGPCALCLCRLGLLEVPSPSCASQTPLGGTWMTDTQREGMRSSGFELCTLACFCSVLFPHLPAGAASRSRQSKDGVVFQLASLTAHVAWP